MYCPACMVSLYGLLEWSVCTVRVYGQRVQSACMVSLCGQKARYQQRACSVASTCMLQTADPTSRYGWQGDATGTRGGWRCSSSAGGARSVTTTSDRGVPRSSAGCWDTKGKVNSKTGRFSAGRLRIVGIQLG